MHAAVRFFRATNLHPSIPAHVAGQDTKGHSGKSVASIVGTVACSRRSFTASDLFFVLKMWESSRYTKKHERNSSRMLRSNSRSHLCCWTDIPLRFAFLQQRGRVWSASIWSYDADGSGVSHLVAPQSSTILSLATRSRMEPLGWLSRLNPFDLQLANHALRNTRLRQNLKLADSHNRFLRIKDQGFV